MAISKLDLGKYNFVVARNVAVVKGTSEVWQSSFFDQAHGFLASVHSIEQIRKRLSPETRTDLDEIGSVLPAIGPGNLVERNRERAHQQHQIGIPMRRRS